MDLVGELLFLGKNVKNLSSRKLHLRKQARALVQRELENRGRNIAKQFGYEKSRGTASEYVLLSMLDLTENQRRAASETLRIGARESRRISEKAMIILGKKSDQASLENSVLSLFSQWYTKKDSSEPTDTSYEGLSRVYEEFREQMRMRISSYTTTSL